jgi:hypothetical protein
VLRAQPHFARAAWPKVDGETYEPRFVESFVRQRLDNRRASRPRSTVRDVRTPIDRKRTASLPDGEIRFQWRAPLLPDELDAVFQATLTASNPSVRLYGNACAQACVVASWPHVSRLALDGAYLPQPLPEFSHVRELALDGLPDDLAAALTQFPQVQRLDIEARGGTLGVASLQAAPRIERLAIAGARCEGMASAAGLRALRTLELRDVRLDDPNATMRLPGLEALRLCSISKLRSIEALRGHAEFRVLALEGLTHVDDVRALSTLPKLESLELTGMWQLHVDDVEFVATLPNLRRLKLDIGGRRKNLEIYRRRPLAEPLPFGSDVTSLTL